MRKAPSKLEIYTKSIAYFIHLLEQDLMDYQF